MIQHLNQFGFYKYGMREPERSAEDIRRGAKMIQTVELDWEKQTVFQAVSDTRVLPDGSMTVLSVSRDGENFDSFYLDQYY